MFRLPTGRRKEDLIQTLLGSDYSHQEVMGPATELAIGVLVEEFVPKSVWADILRDHGLASSGSRHELLLRLVENRLLDGRQTLGELNPSHLREVYYELFGRVPTADAPSVIAEILNAFVVPSREDRPHGEEDAAPRERTRDELRSFEYEVALSFAGEQRAYVEQVAKIVQAAGVRVFYDEFEEIKMWGKDLASFLEQLFREKARFCVLFLSADYARKAWPRWEGRAATARLVQERGEYVLPVRFDDTELPGLPPTTKYLDGRKLSPAELAENILQKLRFEGRMPDRSTLTAPIQNSQNESSSSGAEAERIAVQFMKAKKPNAELSVSSVQQRGPSRWTVEGDAYEKHERGGSSYHWTVDLEGTGVVSYNLKPGVGWFVG